LRYSAGSSPSPLRRDQITITVECSGSRIVALVNGHEVAHVSANLSPPRGGLRFHRALYRPGLQLQAPALGGWLTAAALLQRDLLDDRHRASGFSSGQAGMAAFGVFTIWKWMSNRNPVEKMQMACSPFSIQALTWNYSLSNLVASLCCPSRRRDIFVPGHRPRRLQQ